jgi:hypothetical protein
VIRRLVERVLGWFSLGIDWEFDDDFEWCDCGDC